MHGEEVLGEGILGEGIVYEVVLDSASGGRTFGGLRSGGAHSGNYANPPGDSPASSDFDPGNFNRHDGEPVILDPNQSAAYFAVIRIARCEC